MIYMAYTLLSIMPVLLGGCCSTCSAKMQRGCSDLSATHWEQQSSFCILKKSFDNKSSLSVLKQRIRGPRESVTHWVLISSGCWHAGRLYRINVHMLKASSPVYTGGKTHSVIIPNLYWYNAKIEPKLYGWEEKKRKRKKHKWNWTLHRGRPTLACLAGPNSEQCLPTEKQ